jgi:hypothetical protein
MMALPQAAGTAAAAPAGSNAFSLAASLEGRNEVASSNGRSAGSASGQAVALIAIQGDQLTYTLSWRGVDRPASAVIRTGASGVNGPVALRLFSGLRGDRGWVSGKVRISDPALLASLHTDPGGYYVDLDTGRFPDGAVRGQLHLLDRAVGTGADAAVQASVVRGSQIYACTKQSDGSFAFTQNNVAAQLGGDIQHSFVQPNAGPPQWRAPDGSAVTGTLVTKNANGTGNIAELNLNTTQIGAAQGLLANAVEVLRLNTVGGVAPTGTCDPATQPTVAVPYHADYLFIN